ncbi:ABC transporter permease [Streptomyces sp. NBC_01244]|uniref:ABC transporter permease n=1 Tax=Streptomyces sp. NBC_01244 TaxID=2903797 RepID=UPI002E0F4A58|nr:ABC transporter permease [Streptomyces sp. NBC_01244]
MVTRSQPGLAAQAISCWKTSFLSFRALFNWLTPGQFVLAMVATPIMEMIFFAFLGSSLGVENSRFFLLGGAMLAACGPSVAGGVMALTSERHFGTFEHLLVSRRSRSYLLLMRAIPYSFMGIVASALTLVAGMIALRVTLPPRELATFVILLFFGCLSSAFFGMALGVLGLVVSNVFLLMNVAISTISIGAALVVPFSVLPVGVQLASHVLPVRHVAAGVRNMDVQDFGSSLLWNAGSELLVAAGWALVMLASFSRLESRMRREG